MRLMWTEIGEVLREASTRDLALSPFDPRINGFPGLQVEHCYVRFVDHIAALVFEI